MEWTVAVGVDTHKATHVAVALDRLGRELGACELEAETAGYERLLRWAGSFGGCCFAIEGAASYGAGLARFLDERGLPVFECERPSRRERRRGKNDHLDAELAARRLLAGDGSRRASPGSAAASHCWRDRALGAVLSALSPTAQQRQRHGRNARRVCHKANESRSDLRGKCPALSAAKLLLSPDRAAASAAASFLRSFWPRHRLRCRHGGCPGFAV